MAEKHNKMEEQKIVAKQSTMLDSKNEIKLEKVTEGFFNQKEPSKILYFCKF